MANTCGGTEAGPFEQTLFLGCSVSKFGMNMGWGSDSSSASITLIQDIAHARSDSAYAPLANHLENIKNPISRTVSNTFAGTVDNNKDLHKTIAIGVDTAIGGSKFLWPAKIDAAKKEYTGRDPGFLALDRGISGPAYDIMGIPVYFKFLNGIEFGGYIHSWKASGSQGGSPIFDVEIRSFSNLLNNSWLIIDNYVGSISSLIPGVTIDGINIAVPTLDVNRQYSNTIEQGNMPNVFNIYGYMLDKEVKGPQLDLNNSFTRAYGLDGEGFLKKSEQGLSAFYIYQVLTEMLGHTFPRPSAFAPYGALVGRTVMAMNGQITKTTTQIPGTNFTLNDAGICPNILASDGYMRSLFHLDISEIPAPPVDLYIPGASISIGSFIDTITKGAGLDYYISFKLIDRYTGSIKVNVINRRKQPSRNTIKNMVTNLLVGSNNTVDKYAGFRYGEEYNDQIVRSMYIGGKQKRLYQVLSTHLALQQTTMVFDPYRGSFMSPLGNITNSIRVPDENSTRYFQPELPQTFSKIEDGTAAAVAELKTWKDDSGNTILDRMGNGFDICQGNYYTARVPDLGITTSSVANHPLYLDLICPYFGENGGDYNDSGSGNNNNTDNIAYRDARKVFWDKEIHQLKIVFKKADITRLLSQPYFEAGEFIVMENEIRAAESGFESWFNYCFENVFNTNIELLMYTAFRRIYSNIPNNFFNTIGIISWNMMDKDIKTQSFRMNPSEMSMENANTYVRAFYDDLKKIHAFFAEINSKYYGKQFMVRTPGIRFYRSYANKIFSDWEVSTEGAWEEPGNFIDDTIVVGSTLADLFTNDSGLIQPILGFNANGEKATRDDFVDSSLREATGGMFATLAKAYSKFSSRSAATNAFFYFPLEHNLSPSDYAYVKYENPTAVRTGLNFTPTNGIGTANFQTAQGDSVPPDWSWKMYVKSQVDSKISFIDGSPRIIVSLPNPIYIGGGKNECENSLAFVMIHDAILANHYNRMVKSEYNRANIAKACALAWSLYGSAGLVYGQTPTVRYNNVGPNMSIGRKAACPAFAAIPIQFNLATYGPWINHPGLVSAEIFGQDSNDFRQAVENMIGGVKLEEDQGLVPWEYGSMSDLDNYITEKIKDDVNYQQVLEQGEINVIGFLLTDPNNSPYFIGDIIGDTAIGGSVINNVSIDIGENGITSNYVIRTYTRKIGFFNKDTADRFKEIAQQNFKRRKELNNSINNIANSIKQNFFPNTSSVSMGNTPKPLRWSPAGVLTGGAYIHLNRESSISNSIYSSINFSPDWYMRPYGNVSTTPKNLPRYLTDVGLQEVQELPREFDSDYDRKSIMSLDGIFSPVSLYPTEYGATYSIAKYPRSQCPICAGNGTYSYKYISTDSLPASPNFNDIKNAQKTVSNRPCYFCEEDNTKDKNKKQSVTPRETTPPYIIASGTDLQIISSNTITGIGGISGNPIINYSTLNPVLLSSGEFSCYQNRQNNDYSAHSIDMVGVGKTVPRNDNSMKLSYGKNIDNNFNPYDINYKNYCSAEGLTPMSFKSVEGYSNTESAPANNMRFFGLRGPLVVHGWGYDTEGYPVPNASGEYKLDAAGNIMQDSNMKPLYKNQTQNPDGSWTKPYREHTFYKGWGQLPGTWPVGPVDLRWDDNAKVWTIGANYKNVWIQIEQDLIGQDPARGQIISDLDKNPLPSGLRKLVFVKDNLGINPAPRGAQIYCKYDSDSGFYEPIYNRPFITSGVIQGAASVDIYQIYSTDNTTYRTTYKNPLGFNVSNGENGLFVFLGDSWVLESYRC